MSALTTKSAVYILARTFPGTPILMWAGAFMTCFPIFYAVIVNDMRRVLSYSLINQVGFMICGIGIGTQLAINGVVAHAFCHIIHKALLFMSTGAVMHMTGKIRGTDLGGLYKTMPYTAVCCMIGAASISAFPFFSGFNRCLSTSRTAAYTTVLICAAGFQVYRLNGISEQFPLGPDVSLNLLADGLSLPIAFIVYLIVRILILPLPTEMQSFCMPLMITALITMSLPLLALAIVVLCLGLYPQPVLTMLRSVIGIPQYSVTQLYL